MRADGDTPLIALGVMSTILDFGCESFGGRTRCRTTSASSAARRARLRAEHRQSPGRDEVVQRFLIAGVCEGCHLEPYMRKPRPAAIAESVAEGQREGDLTFLPMHEDVLSGCARKYLLWLRMALEVFPRAGFIAFGDDDVYISYSHMVADLRRAAAQRRTADEQQFWGLIFWRPYYNAASMCAAEGFLYQFHDGGVTKERLRIERCLAALAANVSRGRASRFCSEKTLGAPVQRMCTAGEIGPLTPTPMANGPLFAVSRSLARSLAPLHAAPQRWLTAFKQTQLVQFARSRRRIPYKLRQTGCWPCGDATFGVWLAQMSAELNLTLVNTPLMVSHHVFPTSKHGAFGNSSIVLHGLKDNATDHFWHLAKQRGSGAFEPPKRSCGNCARMGWITWPGSPLKRWRCCGERVRRADMRHRPRTIQRAINSSAFWRYMNNL